jgi:hypothetical protein
MSIPGGRLTRADVDEREFGNETLGNLADVTLQGITIRGKKVKAVIEELISDAVMVRTTEGASTIVITVNDYNRTIVKSALVTESSTLVIDKMKFVLVKVQKRGNNLELTFEDWAVAQLRKKKGPKKANRNKVTRAQFAEQLVKEIKGLKFYSPEKNIKQDIYPIDDHGVSVRELAPTGGTGSNGGGTGWTGGGGGAATRGNWARDFLDAIAVPQSTSNHDAMHAWMATENTQARCNPLGTSRVINRGETLWNDHGVKEYRTYDDGIEATRQTITLSSFGYPAIMAALQAGNNANTVLQAVEDSDWGTVYPIMQLDDVQADRAKYAAIRIPGAADTAPRNVNDADTTQTADNQRGQQPGFEDGTAFTVQGTLAVIKQIRNLETILKKGDAMGMNKWLLQVAVLIAITDSKAYNLPIKDSPTRDEDIELWLPRAGIYQFTIKQYPNLEKWTIEQQTEKVLITAKRHYDWWLDAHPGEGKRVLHRLANDVTRRDIGADFDHYGERYLEFVQESQHIVQLFYGERSDVSLFPDAYNQQDYNLEVDLAAQPTVVKEPYEFTRGTPEMPENSWECLQRLADEVNWRCFSVNGTIYFCRDKTLLRNKPLDSIAEFKNGVDYIDFDYDIGKPVSQIEVDCRAERWTVPPGATVIVQGIGPGTGRYIVQEFERSLFSDRARITLYGAQPQLKEPAPDTHVESIDPDNPYAPQDPTLVDYSRAGPRPGGTVDPGAGGARAIVEGLFDIAVQAGGPDIYILSGKRETGGLTTGGTVSDHGWDDATRAARDIALRGHNSPTPQLDAACVAIGNALGRNFALGATIDADTREFHGFRTQVIWRTPKYGGHMNHIHVGARDPKRWPPGT